MWFEDLEGDHIPGVHVFNAWFAFEHGFGARKADAYTDIMLGSELLHCKRMLLMNDHHTILTKIPFVLEPDRSADMCSMLIRNV